MELVPHVQGPSDSAHPGQKVLSAVAAARKAEDEAKRLEEEVRGVLLTVTKASRTLG